MGRVKTTKSRRPVQLIYSEEFENYTDARKREIYLKSGTGRDWLKTKMEGWPSG
jgi:putative endonuclease